MNSNKNKNMGEKEFKIEIRELFSTIEADKITIGKFKKLLEEKLQIKIDREKKKIMSDYLVRLMTDGTQTQS